MQRKVNGSTPPTRWFGKQKREIEGGTGPCEIMDVVLSYCERALALGMSGAKIINPQLVTTGEWVRMKCWYGCPGYGKRLSCPPYSPSPEVTRKVLDCYEVAILLHRKLREQNRREEMRKEFNECIVALELEIFLDGYYKAWSMISGACRLCKECNVSGTCLNGFKMRPAMEACGIDVFKVARENGFEIEVVKCHEEEINVFGLILVK